MLEVGDVDAASLGFETEVSGATLALGPFEPVEAAIANKAPKTTTATPPRARTTFGSFGFAFT